MTCRKIYHRSTVRLMADDCVMYKQIRSESDCLDLQKDLDILCQWENRWQMKFNSKKCFVMNITDKRNPIQLSYSMQDSVLETVDHHTYLGIEISSKLTWNLHVSNISSKANRTLGLLRRHLHSCKPNIKEIAYNLVTGSAKTGVLLFNLGSIPSGPERST